MGERPNAIAGYGICFGTTDYDEDKDYNICENISKIMNVTLDTYHNYDETGIYLCLAHTHTDWDDVKVLNVEKPENADQKLTEVLGFLWEHYPEFCERYDLPKVEDAKFGWFLYAYYW